MLPFKKFVITLFFFNKDVDFISQRLKTFGYSANEEDLKGVLSELYNELPPNIVDVMKSRGMLDLNDEVHCEWLKRYGVYEFYNYIYIVSQGKPRGGDAPAYFKWFDDCTWVHSHNDVMSLINIFIFNEEPDDSICDVVWFKYRKRIGLEMLSRYKEIFWNTNELTAKDAIEHCIAFRKNTMILRNMRSGVQEIERKSEEEANDGTDVVFHGSDYIKWKIGYKKFNAPGPSDFFEMIKRDAAFKYYEAMNMSQHAETIKEDGSSSELGSFDKTVIHRKNVEDARVKQVRAWLDIYLKANEAAPSGDVEKDNKFFANMAQTTLDFNDAEERIVSIDDNPDMLNDVKGDMSKATI